MNVETANQALPPIAGFWRRLAAFVVDILLLGILGQIIGWSASSFWFTVGPYGRILGFLIVLTYFGLMNSRVGNGQTVGKRLLKIAVRDRANKPISFKRSLLRISILALPVLLNGWALPVFNMGILAWLVGVIVFGVGVAIVYTMLFNCGSRQGIHDLICRTYVVHLKGEPIDVFPQAAKKHWIISGVLAALAIAAVTAAVIFNSAIISRVDLANATDVQRLLINDSRFHTASVSYQTTRVVASNISPGVSTTRSITVGVWYAGVPSSEDRSEAMIDIAEVALENINNIGQYDSLTISIRSAYDLGIASGHISYVENKSISEWRQEAY